MTTSSTEAAAGPPGPALDEAFVRGCFPALATPWALFDNAGGSVATRPVIEHLSAFLRESGFQLGATYEGSRECRWWLGPAAISDDDRQIVYQLIETSGTPGFPDEIVVRSERGDDRVRGDIPQQYLPHPVARSHNRPVRAKGHPGDAALRAAQFGDWRACGDIPQHRPVFAAGDKFGAVRAKRGKQDSGVVAGE